MRIKFLSWLKNFMISVIIPAKNEAKYISSCLESIRRQKLQDFEIICIVDKNSSDGTADVASVYSDILVKDDGTSVGKARNGGAEKAV